MILVIPAIELCHGRCARAVSGKPGTEHLYSVYAESPEKFSSLLRRENAKSIHVTDRDALETGDTTVNRDKILGLVRSVDIPVALVSDFSTPDDVRFWLENGVYRVVLGKVARLYPTEIQNLIEEFTPSRVVFGIVSHHGWCMHHGSLPAMRDVDFARFVESLGAKRLVFTDASWEGTMCGPNIEELLEIAHASHMKITAAGGVANVQQLWDLQSHERDGIDSVVIGRALYENKFPCQKIWREAEAELEEEFMLSTTLTMQSTLT